MPGIRKRKAGQPQSSDLMGTRQNPIVLSDDEGEGRRVFTSGKCRCRVCLGPEVTEADPIIKLGCKCQGDLSNGHESCLKRWFKQQLVRKLDLDCEVCKRPLGADTRSIILTRNLPEQAPGPERPAPIVLLLNQVPLEELDRLQVPTETPAFDALPAHMQAAVEAYLEVYLEGEERHRARYRDDEIQPRETRENASGDALPQRDPQSVIETDARLRRESALEKKFVKMLSVVRMRAPGEEGPEADTVGAYFPRFGGSRGGMNIKIAMKGENPRGEMLRIPPVCAHTPGLQNLQRDLQEFVPLNADPMLWQPGREGLVILPRCMIVDNIYTDRARISNNICAAGSRPSAPPARRQFTYAR